MPLMLSEALACADAGIAKAREMGVRISIVVIDEFGQLVQLDRMDGASLMSPDVAEAKAVTALNFRRPTSAVAAMDQTTLEALGDVVNFKVVPLAGGVPLFEGDDIRGAIGVSGATAQQDEEIAKHASKG